MWSFAGLDVRITVPALLELPARARPTGASMDGAKRTLTWRLPGSAPGAPAPATAAGGAPPLSELMVSPCAFSAAFLVSGGEMATRAALRSVAVEVVLQGAPGATLTGVMLEQLGFSGAVAAGACSWVAQVSGKLRL